MIVTPFYNVIFIAFIILLKFLIFVASISFTQYLCIIIWYTKEFWRQRSQMDSLSADTIWYSTIILITLYDKNLSLFTRHFHINPGNDRLSSYSCTILYLMCNINAINADEIWLFDDFGNWNYFKALCNWREFTFTDIGWKRKQIIN